MWTQFSLIWNLSRLISSNVAGAFPSQHWSRVGVPRGALHIEQKIRNHSCTQSYACIILDICFTSALDCLRIQE